MLRHHAASAVYMEGKLRAYGAATQVGGAGCYRRTETDSGDTLETPLRLSVMTAVGVRACRGGGGAGGNVYTRILGRVGVVTLYNA